MDKPTPSGSPRIDERRLRVLANCVGFHGRNANPCTPAEALMMAQEIIGYRMGQPKTGGELTYEEMVAACKNVGLDLSCGECASIFYTGTGGYTHTCALKDAAPLVIAVGEPTEHPPRVTPGERAALASAQRVTEDAGRTLAEVRERYGLDTSDVKCTCTGLNTVFYVDLCEVHSKLTQEQRIDLRHRMTEGSGAALARAMHGVTCSVGTFDAANGGIVHRDVKPENVYMAPEQPPANPKTARNTADKEAILAFWRSEWPMGEGDPYKNDPDTVLRLQALVERVRADERDRMADPSSDQETPIPMVLFCEHCKKQHIDEGIWATRPHRTHQCVDDAAGKGCGKPFTPSAHRTVGVQYKDLKFQPLEEPKEQK